MRMLLTMLVLVFMGCAADEPLSPTGRWSTTATFGPGDCGLAGEVAADVFLVTDAGSGSFLITMEDPTVQVTGTILCSPGDCRLQATATKTGVTTDGVNFTATVGYDYLLDADDSIAGDGTMSISFASGGQCSQAFSTVGTRS